MPPLLHAAARDALYRDNERRRLEPRRLAAGELDGATPVSVLGLEQITISRLVRIGITRIEQLLDASVEDLWRSIGRHGIADIMERLTFQGLQLRPLNDYERWRLGLVDREHLPIRVDPDSPTADLWPHLGPTLTDVLQKRGLTRVTDLAPRNEAELLQLYRLGKGNLRKILAVLTRLAQHATGHQRERLEVGIALITARSVDHRPIRTRAARQQNGSRNERIEPWQGRPGGDAVSTAALHTLHSSSVPSGDPDHDRSEDPR
ncbi:MAG: hypothetical protein KIT73_05605 [Burkholderiales bacterium]|nr:hypothetical protein [Burkholderiales bacterium]